MYKVPEYVLDFDWTQSMQFIKAYILKFYNLALQK